MQKIFSTPLDEATLNEMERVTQKLGISKRQFLEEAIQLRVERLSRDEQGDVCCETLGGAAAARIRCNPASIFGGAVNFSPPPTYLIRNTS